MIRATRGSIGFSRMLFCSSDSEILRGGSGTAGGAGGGEAGGGGSAASSLFGGGLLRRRKSFIAGRRLKNSWLHASTVARINLTSEAPPRYQGANHVPVMSKSYFPSDRAGQIEWYENFATEFPKVGEKLGFSSAEIANASNDCKYAVHILKTLGPEADSAFAVLEGQSSGDFVDLPAGANAPPAVRPGIDTRRQARVERIKRHTNYSDAIRQQLRIGVPALDEKSYKAELGKPRQTGPTVTIPFRKAGGKVSGINLYRQRKGDREAQKVGFFMRTPAIDTAPGKAGELTYTAHAVANGNEIGQVSESVSVTVS